jgi:hypothetical protein
VFVYAPAIQVDVGARVSAIGGAAGSAPPDYGVGGAGGLGRIRISALSASCMLAGTFTPPLAASCGVSPVGGTRGDTYVATYPN